MNLSIQQKNMFNPIALTIFGVIIMIDAILLVFDWISLPVSFAGVVLALFFVA